MTEFEEKLLETLTDIADSLRILVDAVDAHRRDEEG